MEKKMWRQELPMSDSDSSMNYTNTLKKEKIPPVTLIGTSDWSKMAAEELEEEKKFVCSN